MLMKRLLYLAGGLLALAGLGALSAPKLKGAIKAAFVEVVQPSKPFYATLFTPVNFPGVPFAGGTDQGTLGVTNITVTNFQNTPTSVTVFQPVLNSNAADCGGGVQGFGGPDSIDITIHLQAQQTLSLPFPTPLVFTPQGGHSCIAVVGPAGFFETYITGFVN